ncbi:HAD family hydrolase [Nesterenkonia halotolerans]|uniref:Phosphoglycolate phosphatase-like HAD superfamily hydrolase n=1 Tax=Nesterenkonia halotolerans TaxID=225325 RepID=A0ABR9J9W2_9MICC|nr:HAD family hydrolase [Nesterenkonia halotolerans]MBE1515773.1 phosphoglycolate phosphatase-like HAD superfamily hydrolase [Nesterenkonia halotolerans]
MSASVDPSRYQTLVFDCDGVVLDSNRVKTRAFYEAALPYGEAAAQRLVDYHVSHGGISRYKKFALFLEEMVDGRQGPGLDSLLDAYATEVRAGLMACEIAPGLDQLRQVTRESRWLIVSGGDQEELREIFHARGISSHFDGGIFGSPDTKDEILAREMGRGNISGSALFLGDSTYDHQASSQAGLDFVFVSAWTEVPGWDTWCREQGIASVESLQQLL